MVSVVNLNKLILYNGSWLRAIRSGPNVAPTLVEKEK